MAQKNKTQGFIAGLLIILLLGLLFAINWEKISTNVKETNFLGIVFGKKEEPLSETTNKPLPITESPAREEQKAQEQIPLVEIETIETATPSDDITKVTPTNPRPDSKEDVPKTEPEITQVKEEPRPVEEKKQNATLFFIHIDTNGAIVRKELSRVLKENNSPLTNSIHALLNGPTREEQEKGLRSLIPEGTELLSATVQNKTAVLNFSEEFEFNSFGSDGYRGQLMQVVYTATAFSTVENVQLLVEGTHKQFLGSEGIWIGSPLNRNNFIW